jgi:multimeric flavodoxin WrbA
VAARLKALLIVYHSMTGGTAQMAAAAAAGAGVEEGIRVSLLRAAEAAPDDVLSADGYIFASPENLAAMSGMMKDFFDRTYYAALDKINGRPYLAMICAGSDGSNAVRQIERIATGWRLNRVADPFVICTHAQSPEEILRPKIIAEKPLEHCAQLGRTIAAGMAMGIF